MNLRNLLLTGALLVSPALWAQEHSGGVPEMKADCYPAVYGQGDDATGMGDNSPRGEASLCDAGIGRADSTRETE